MQVEDPPTEGLGGSRTELLHAPGEEDEVRVVALQRRSHGSIERDRVAMGCSTEVESRDPRGAGRVSAPPARVVADEVDGCAVDPSIGAGIDHRLRVGALVGSQHTDPQSRHAPRRLIAGADQSC